MDRLFWCIPALQSGESLKVQIRNVDVVVPNTKTHYDGGILAVSSHRIIWQSESDKACVFCLPLPLIALCEVTNQSKVKPAVQLHLLSPSEFSPSSNSIFSLALQTPVSSQSPSKLLHLIPRSQSPNQPSIVELARIIGETIKRQEWDYSTATSQLSALKMSSNRIPSAGSGIGIAAVQNQMESQRREVDQTIKTAFDDLNKLMDKAKEMVTLANSISKRLRESSEAGATGGAMSDDETARFKQYLLGLGVEEPVTRDSSRSSTQYYAELSRELSRVLHAPIRERGGILSLVDAYCFINRARGLMMLSPEDLLRAAQNLEPLGLPIRLYTFESGVKVLRLADLNDQEKCGQIVSLVEGKHNTGLGADELSRALNCSVLVAKERLLHCEKLGLLCRDESLEGLKFFPNRFLGTPP